MAARHIELVEAANIADAGDRLRHVIVRNMMALCSIDVHRREGDAERRVRINLDPAVTEDDRAIDDDIRNAICYQRPARRWNKFATAATSTWSGGWPRTSPPCAWRTGGWKSALGRVEKLDICEDAESVGVEIERFNSKV